MRQTKSVITNLSLLFLETESETDRIHPASGEEGRIIARTSLNIISCTNRILIMTDL